METQNTNLQKLLAIVLLLLCPKLVMADALSGLRYFVGGAIVAVAIQVFGVVAALIHYFKKKKWALVMASLVLLFAFAGYFFFSGINDDIDELNSMMFLYPAMVIGSILLLSLYKYKPAKPLSNLVYLVVSLQLIGIVFGLLRIWEFAKIANSLLFALFSFRYAKALLIPELGNGPIVLKVALFCLYASLICVLISYIQLLQFDYLLENIKLNLFHNFKFILRSFIVGVITALLVVKMLKRKD